jgi:hypothetical protein
MGIVVALLVLSVLIFFHELGHFTAARFFGVRVDVFSIGFGKKLFTKKIGDTQWSLSAIPLGGYVKMKGQDDSDPTKISYDEDSYNVKKPWQRIIILLAGPFANFLLAFILYFAIANMGVPKLLPYVGKVGENTPAYQAGLKSQRRTYTYHRARSATCHPADSSKGHRGQKYLWREDHKTYHRYFSLRQTNHCLFWFYRWTGLCLGRDKESLSSYRTVSRKTYYRCGRCR